jgi:hypothetical protein
MGFKYGCSAHKPHRNQVKTVYAISFICHTWWLSSAFGDEGSLGALTSPL